MAKEEDVSAAAAAVVGSSVPILECGFGMGGSFDSVCPVPNPCCEYASAFFCTLAVVRQVGQLRNGLFLLLSPLFALSFACPHSLCVCAPFRASAVIITRRVAVGSTTSYKRDKARGQTGLATPLPQMIGLGAATTIHVLVHVQRSPYAIMQCSFSLKVVAVEEGGAAFFVASSLSGEAVFHFHLITFL